ncbi:MAG: thiamine pyrophosphate-dependent enzyme [Nanoarchaeota archaeon]
MAKQSKSKKPIKTNVSIRTNATNTWCPGCYNFQILAGVQNFLENQMKMGKNRDDFSIVSGIGCNSKIFDYINLGGLNSLHGRVIPACIGIKVAKPSQNVFGFSGDGDSYAEGMEHLIHAARYNSNFKYIVHNNQVFALTIAEPTPVTEKGYKDKTTPKGVKLAPMNPIKLMLAAGASFVARVFADVNQVQQVLEEAQKHKGFAFIEVIQPCIIFHADAGYKDKLYNLQKSGHNKADLKAAMEKAEEWDYNGVKTGTKIPVGIFYQNDNKPVFEELI